MKLLLFIVAGLISFWLAIVKPVIFWLKTGHFPNYDFLDLLGLNDSYRLSDWVGLNEILSGIMSVNIFFAWCVVLMINIDKLD
jgi:hypothetical protein